MAHSKQTQSQNYLHWPTVVHVVFWALALQLSCMFAKRKWESVNKKTSGIVADSASPRTGEEDTTHRDNETSLLNVTQASLSEIHEHDEGGPSTAMYVNGTGKGKGSGAVIDDDDDFERLEFSDEELQCKRTFEPYIPWLMDAEPKKRSQVQLAKTNWRASCIKGGNEENVWGTSRRKRRRKSHSSFHSSPLALTSGKNLLGESPKIPTTDGMRLSLGIKVPTTQDCYGCWSRTTGRPLRIGSNRALNASHRPPPPTRDGMLPFDSHVHFDRSKKSISSFRQVVMNAMRFLVLRIDFKHEKYTTGRQGFLDVKSFEVCQGEVTNLKATSMEMKDAYFEVFGDSLEFVVKEMVLEAALDYDFDLKIPPLPLCVGDKGHITVQAKADIRMRFDGQTNRGACSYDNMATKILTVPGSYYPEWMVKLSAKALSSNDGIGFNLVPLIGKSALIEMCKQFRGINSEMFEDRTRLTKMKGQRFVVNDQGNPVFFNGQLDRPLLDVAPKVPKRVLTMIVAGVVLQIALLVGACCLCHFCGWSYHERKRQKELDARMRNDPYSREAGIAEKRSLAQLKFCATTCPCCSKRSTN